jgi:hypothetical protein
MADDTDLPKLVHEDPHDDRYERFTCPECGGAGEADGAPCRCARKGRPSVWWRLKSSLVSTETVAE